MNASKKLFCLTPLCALLAAGSVHATNGMLMEGYGPISTGMGGASQAIDHGNAGMAQNPATLGMMADGTARLDVAFGILGPDVSSSAGGMTAKSGGTSYVMPAFGYTRRSGALTYGVGMFAQGGMGTEYDAGSFLNCPTPGGACSNLPSRSELGVGNVIFPLAYQVNQNLTVGATLKFMWSSLDMKMTIPGGALVQGMGLVTSATGNLGFATDPANTATPQSVVNANWATINFSDENDFTGAAKSTGFGAALGATYKVNQDVIVGASYQFKSALNDMETASSAASLNMQGMPSPDIGKITVIDFQMPSVLAVGASWQASPSLLLAADVKYIGWVDAMKSFMMRYDSSMGSGSVNFAMPQNWKDQTVLNLGMAWKANDALTLRAGLNLADNPVPDTFVNPLFPATVRDHVTLGLGYQVSKAGDFNMSVTMAPSVSVNSGAGVTISHAQTNWQFMYSHRF
jgi:long-chain fatty acid transport protein